MAASAVWLERCKGLDLALTAATQAYADVLARGPMRLKSGAHADKLEKLWHNQLRRCQEVRSKIKRDLNFCLGAYIITRAAEGDDDQF